MLGELWSSAEAGVSEIPALRPSLPGPTIVSAVAGSRFADAGALSSVPRLLAFGGANTVAPEMDRQAGAMYHGLSEKAVFALFVIAQATPGLPGALVEAVALCTPPGGVMI